MIRKLIFLLMFLVLFFCFLAHAQTVDEIIEKNITARGGYEKIKSLNTLKMTGKLHTQGIETQATVWMKRPNLMRMDITLQGMKVIQAYDGEGVWTINPFAGIKEPKEVTGEDVQRMIEQADFDGPLVDYREKNQKIELIGREELEGTPVYKLKLTLKSGNVRHLYLDAEHFLEIKGTAAATQNGEKTEVEIYISDYKDVNGLMLAHAFQTRISKKPTASGGCCSKGNGGAADGTIGESLSIEKIEMNVDMDDSLFKMPVVAKKQ